jgi:ABC-type phosphate/phosphonate transport system substrate-binding protein
VALGTALATALGREVDVVFGESPAAAVGAQPADIVIGKRSVVIADSLRGGRRLDPIAALTDLDGSTAQHGLVVVRRDDPATGIADLADHRILLGPADCDEKHAAARTLLVAAGIAVPADTPVAEACSDGAAAVIAAGRAGPPVATLISSYARPLLEGCGTIKRGDLKVVGETAAVPFITAFVAADLDPALREAITAALLATADGPLLLLALETTAGFVALTPAADGAAVPPAHNPDWPGFRGRDRDARVAWLPETLPATKRVRWKQTLFSAGLGGVAVAGDRVIVGDRDSTDTADVFHGLDRATGKRVWTVEYPARGRLDYGNSPRATPLIEGDRAYLLGAFGHLQCVSVADGTILWQRHLRDDFAVSDALVWGVCSSPLVTDGLLIVNPGAPDAALVALDPATGDERWRVPGGPAAFASLIVVEREGRRQLVGFDKLSCGGWDPVRDSASGRCRRGWRGTSTSPHRSSAATASRSSRKTTAPDCSVSTPRGSRRWSRRPRHSCPTCTHRSRLPAACSRSMARRPRASTRPRSCRHGRRPTGRSRDMRRCSPRRSACSCSLDRVSWCSSTPGPTA